MLYRSMMLLAMVAPVAGCSVSTEPVDSLNVALAVEPATFRVGDTALLQLTLSNPTLDTIRFRAAQCPVSFEVFDDSDSISSASIRYPFGARILITSDRYCLGGCR